MLSIISLSLSIPLYHLCLGFLGPHTLLPPCSDLLSVFQTNSFSAHNPPPLITDVSRIVSITGGPRSYSHGGTPPKTMSTC